MVWDDSKEKEMMFTEELHRQGIVKESIPQWGRKAGVMKQTAGEKPDSCSSGSLRKAKNKGPPLLQKIPAIWK